MKRRISSRTIIYLILSVFLLVSLLPLSVSANDNTKEDFLKMDPISQDQMVSNTNEQVINTAALNFVEIAPGGDHTCALTVDGGVKCWGANDWGQLGDGTLIDKNLPIDVIGLSTGVISISAGDDHTCAVTSSNAVKCWGGNYLGQLGDGTTTKQSTPVDVVDLSSGVSAISLGLYHSCALTVSGGVKCWGSNNYGQLGDGTTSQKNTPVEVVGLSSGISDISSGGSHTCVKTTSGGGKCWGSNDYGQLGDATFSQRNTPVDVIGISEGISEITTGQNHTCAVTQNGEGKCWGWNSYGQLGDGSTFDSEIPVNVVGLQSGVSAIVGSRLSTCALTGAGGVKCWGRNDTGQVGDGTMFDRNVPVDVVGLSSGMIKISAGSYHICVLSSSGKMKCWGRNFYSQLGDGTILMRSIPINVVNTKNNISNIATGSWHTCNLDANGSVNCWGENYWGELGDGTKIHRSTPGSVIGLPGGINYVATGRWHTCVLTSSNGVMCWGANNYGQLGDGTTTQRSTPVDVVSLSSGVSTIVGGWYHTCALMTNGGVKCWGANSTGQLGDGTTTQQNTPVDVVGLSGDVIALTAGSEDTCAIIVGGSVQCWGRGNSTPSDVYGLESGVSDIATDYTHKCAVVSGGVKCWGINEYGQLGDGTYTDSSIPVDVVGLGSGVIGIDVGYYHSCALTESGGVKCWGRNSNGQLGNGALLNFPTPVDVIGLGEGVSLIEVGGYHNCAQVEADRLKCWGSDSFGQLGIGSNIYSLVPVNVVDEILPSLTTNYTNGQPGSYITITGMNYPSDSQATLLINGEILSSTVSVSPTGSFVVFLDTTGADEGSYFVTASVNPSATTSFILGDGAPLRLQEGGGQTFEVPPGIAYDDFVYLPILSR